MWDHNQYTVPYCQLKRVIQETLTTYVGGEEFFIALDHAIRRKIFLELLMERSGQPLRNVIVSGNFGKFFASLYSGRVYNLILVRGGLRRDGTRVVLDKMREAVHGQQYIFFDDSYYSGITRRKIQEEIERLGGQLVQTYVLYDGSRTLDSSVTGMYRYHD